MKWDFGGMAVESTEKARGGRRWANFAELCDQTATDLFWWRCVCVCGVCGVWWCVVELIAEDYESSAIS